MKKIEKMHPAKNVWSLWVRMPKGMRVVIKKIWSYLGFSKATGTQLRFEIDMLILRIKQSFSIKHKKMLSRYKTKNNLKLHIGCGEAIIDGWINIDCYPPLGNFEAEVLTIDLRSPLIFSDNSVQSILSEHFLEHMNFEDVRNQFIPKVKRVLQDGGVIRFSVPDGEFFINEYLASKNSLNDPLYIINRGMQTDMMKLNEMARDVGHQYLYDFETMKMILEEAGFSNVKKKSFNSTDYVLFKGLDRQDEWRGKISLYVEAILKK